MLMALPLLRPVALFLVFFGWTFWGLALVIGLHEADATPPQEVLSSTLSSSSSSTSSRPNIIILFADNLAYEDISFFQRHSNKKNGQSSTTTTSKPKTPHVDSIGQKGMSFSHWNSAAHLCSASRASLLTGQYPVRTGIYPGVFHSDSVHGLDSNSTATLASQLKQLEYATSIVGKWHLGHARPEYLPTSHGFDEWLGIPYHMSGGSVDNHTCVYDEEAQEMWLPLYQNGSIVQQPVRLEHLAKRYAHAATDFIHRNTASEKPFFLYMAFSHVHQLCAPAHWAEQDTCQWATPATAANSTSSSPTAATFADAVQEMDWIVGQILQSLDDNNIVNNTQVWFTSDNGPWVAEQACSGSKGPFQGQWLREHVPWNCTACPHDYQPDPTPNRPRRCVLSRPQQQQQQKQQSTFQQQQQQDWTLDGVHCGEDVGLGSLWEANLRMPAMVQWPGRIPAQSTSDALVSTLDIMPTALAAARQNSSIQKQNQQSTTLLDGMDLSPILFESKKSKGIISDDRNEIKYVERKLDFHNRVLFFWRDGFEHGPLEPPYGRMDVAAVKVGPRLKAWLWTKSAHYNNDTEVHHDPPLLFDVVDDPAEAHPLDPEKHTALISKVKQLVQQHKKDMEPWGRPLTLDRDANAVPCVDRSTHCRTHDPPSTASSSKETAASAVESVLTAAAGNGEGTLSETR